VTAIRMTPISFEFFPPKTNLGNQIHQLAELAIGQLGSGVALVEDALEPWVLLLDQGQRIVNSLADIGLLCMGAQPLPTGPFRYPEGVHLTVVVAIFQLLGQQLIVTVVEEVLVALIGKAAGQLGATGGEGVGDVLEEDKAQHDVLVLGGVHVGTQLVCGSP
jgi:hypothetical protein